MEFDDFELFDQFKDIKGLLEDLEIDHFEHSALSLIKLESPSISHCRPLPLHWLGSALVRVRVRARWLC